ncbi:MAG: SDR family NAD(P)-dependent oxidoreductase [Nitrospirales bacterium]|nr:SDR family NAD(P)-dependent oxidoreductase [Nitrospira sp.]MDR4501897.1 SDR family NAD(P)-dependent oxidoreductase [Nitrospirales bacterium]
MKNTSLKGKRVLVTGATGFVGSRLARRLMQKGASVRALVRQSSNRETAEDLKRNGIEVCYGDITDRQSISDAVKHVEYIFHIAALFRSAKHAESVFYEVNVEGTRNVLSAAERENVKRVVHCSTGGVHSHIPHPPATEEEPYRPGDIYQLTKCEGEKLAKERFTSGRVKGTIIRPAMIWGQGDTRTLKLFRGVARRRFPIIGSGRTLTHWVDVEDLAEGFILAAEQEAAIGQTYILAGEKSVSLEELVRTISRIAGVRPLPFKIPARPVQLLGSLTEAICKPLNLEPILYRRRVDFFTKTRSFDSSKARKDLGFAPRRSFEAEVQNIFDWYEQHGWLA